DGIRDFHVTGVQSCALPICFAAAGYAVVVFDYRSFGESEGEPRQVLDIAMQHEDWRAALRFARSLEGIDHTRVVAWGTSFSGGQIGRASCREGVEMPVGAGS